MVSSDLFLFTIKKLKSLLEDAILHFLMGSFEVFGGPHQGSWRSFTVLYRSRCIVVYGADGPWQFFFLFVFLYIFF